MDRTKMMMIIQSSVPLVRAMEYEFVFLYIVSTKERKEKEMQQNKSKNHTIRVHIHSIPALTQTQPTTTIKPQTTPTNATTTHVTSKASTVTPVPAAETAPPPACSLGSTSIIPFDGEEVSVPVAAFMISVTIVYGLPDGSAGRLTELRVRVLVVRGDE